MPLRPLAVALVAAISLGSALGLTTPANAEPASSEPVTTEQADVPTAVTQVAIVMPLTVPITDPAVAYVAPKVAPTSPSLIDAETLAFYTSPTGILTAELDAVIDTGVTIGIDPLIITSIRVLGSSAPPSAVAWLSRLAAATNDTFALSFADSDVTAPLQAGRRSVVKDPSLTYAIDPKLFSGAITPGSTPAPPVDGLVAPPLPTSADLFAWSYTLSSIAWPRADTVTTRDLGRIAADFDTTILESTNATRSAPATAGATIGSDGVVIVDQTISTLLGDSLAAATTENATAAIDATTSAITAANAASAQGTVGSVAGSIVLALDRDAPLPTAGLAAAINAIGDLPAADIVGLSVIRTADTAKATLISEAQDSARIVLTKRLLAQESIDADFAAVAADPTLITGERRARLLVTLSPSAERQAGGWGAATSAFLTESDTLLQSVRLEHSSRVLLLADRQSISFAVRNDLDQTITAYIEVRSLNPNLKVEDDRVLITVEPNSQRKGSVPVQAISNGTVDLAVSLRSLDELPLGETEYVPITVQAGWEGPFTLVAGILVVLVFAFGIVRTVVKRRRTRSAPRE